MTVLIASSFTKSLDRLTGQEQSQVKITAFDIQQNPEGKGLSLHRIDRCRDPGFWSARVSRDIRIVLHKRGSDTLLAYVAHHDDAYDWAERRRLDTHPRTGAAQIVEIRESIEQVVVQHYIQEAVRKPLLFEYETDDTLLSWGIPEDWIGTVRQSTEDTVLDIASHLPEEAQQALLCAAVGEKPEIRVEPASNPYAHPDAQRRFRIIGDEAELAAALDAPWDDWAVFLHPAQQEFVDRNFNGPARVIGSAGTGKTVVALHRAVRLAAEDTDAKVLLTTFNENLSDALVEKLDRLTSNLPGVRNRITVAPLTVVARDLAADHLGVVDVATDSEINALLEDARKAAGVRFDKEFLKDEWRLVIDAWNVTDPATYRNLPRLGRKVRMAASKRDEMWNVFEHTRHGLSERKKETEADVLYRLIRNIQDSVFSHVVVDEAQDISVPELHLLAKLVGDRPNGLFFAGDIGQRIFRAAFPWKSAGVDIQGRSRSLKVNYRTSHQIRRQSDLLLPPRLLEADGGDERRLGVSSVFNGPSPQIEIFNNSEDEVSAVATWIKTCLSDGFAPNTIAVLVRSDAEIHRAREAIQCAGDSGVQLVLMHDAKGQEYRAVSVMACDADVIPSEKRLLLAIDERAHREVYDTERHLLYVAATRARERLWLSACDPASEFLDDLSMRQ
ncbi:3'-5' exonuclease [uncultured Sulfitobacter sp.]|uniref:3'-5' exonuclease n=1 Tax=uncultured Sulfitobacter sp. TaxID=191468 RepID=UPI0026105F01|nr:3'-5' exonuclease [uncultured Sulfitobacter sp.]